MIWEKSTYAAISGHDIVIFRFQPPCEFSAMVRSLFALVALGAFLLIPSAASAQMKRLDVSDLKSKMDHNVCPADRSKIVVPLQKDICGGDGTTPPCKQGDTACYADFNDCHHNFVNDALTIVQYNSWLDSHCKPQSLK
jgi:hypothetical protein